MIKVRVCLIASWREVHGYVDSRFGNYAYNTYIFGILIWSVTIKGVECSMEDELFGDRLVKRK